MIQTDDVPIYNSNVNSHHQVAQKTPTTSRVRMSVTDRVRLPCRLRSCRGPPEALS